MDEENPALHFFFKLCLLCGRWAIERAGNYVYNDAYIEKINNNNERTPTKKETKIRKLLYLINLITSVRHI